MMVVLALVVGWLILGAIAIEADDVWVHRAAALSLIGLVVFAVVLALVAG